MSSTTNHLEQINPVQRGLLLVAASAILWSSGGLIVRLLDNTDVWTVVFWRSAFAFVFLLVFIALRDKAQTFLLFRRMGAPGLIVAACFTVASMGLVIALSLTTVANTLILMSTAPFFAALLGRVLLGERVSRRSWLTMLAALFGVVIMVSDSLADGSIAGDLVALLIAASFSIAVVTIRRHHQVRMAPATCLATMLATLISFSLAASLSVSTHDFGLLAFFGAGQLGLGLALFTTGARLAPAAQVALISLLEPILGPVWVLLVLGEHPGWAALLGGAIVLLALLIHTALDLRRARPVTPTV